MADTIRVGLIGTGRVAVFHLEAYKGVPGVEVVAVWNRTKERAEEFARTHSPAATVYDSWQDMLSGAELNAISVTCAPQFRLEPVRVALEHNVHVLVEKPFATDLADAVRMVGLAEGSSSVTAVAFTWRYKPGNLVARRVVEEGRIGQVRHYASTWRMSLPDGLTPDVSGRRYLIEAEGGLGALGDNGSHQFDMLRFVTGLDVTELAGRCFWVAPANPKVRTNYSHSIVGTCTNQAMMSIEHTVPPGPLWVASQREVYIEGSKGYLRVVGGLVDDGRTFVRLEGESTEREVQAKQSELVPETHSGLIADFVSAIRGDGQRSVALPTFDDGMRSLEMVLAGLKADQERIWISVERPGG